MKRRRNLVAAALAAVALVGAACSSSSSNTTTTTASSGGATGSPIKIALITSATGVAAPQFGSTSVGFNAAISAINAAGGANGHKLIGTVYDDGTNPAQVVTQVQKAISDGNVGIVSVTPLMFAAYKYPQQAGLPVTGGGFDGPEWGTQPNTNMFASDTGSVDPTNPPSKLFGEFAKAHGATVACAWGYGISPSSAQAANGVIWSALSVGMTKGVLDTSIPFGGVDFTAGGLAAKQAGCNAVEGTMDVNSGVALTTALQQNNVPVKVNLFAAGYDPALIGTPSWTTLQGSYFSTEFRPVSLPNSGTAAISAALLKYQGRPISQFPTFNIYEAWLGTYLMAKGIERAGANPSSANIITSLRSYTSWDGMGLLPATINYSTNFGHATNPSCQWILKAEKTAFFPVQASPICGAIIEGQSNKNIP